MSETTESDIQALMGEFKNLKADFAKIGELLKDTAVHGGADAADRIRETAEKGWSEAKTKAKGLVEEMEARPLTAALLIFIAGLVFGLLMGRR